MSLRALLLSVILVQFLPGCGYNEIQIAEENTRSCWAEVLDHYALRAELVPGLIRTAQAYAGQDNEVLAQLAEARARVSRVTTGPALTGDPQALAAFRAAQGELSGALARLVTVVDRHPDLGADASFRDLQAQLDGAESRLSAARARCLQSIERYNAVVQSFPGNLLAMVLDYEPKPRPQLDGDARDGNSPPVDFGGPAAR